MEECVKSGNSFISEITCLNVTTSTNAKKSNIQVSLQRLIQDKWVVSEVNKKNRYFLEAGSNTFIVWTKLTVSKNLFRCKIFQVVLLLLITAPFQLFTQHSSP